jgi:hypothetical protein
MPLQGVNNVKIAITDLTDSKNDQLKAIFIKTLQNIAIGTPVDEGRARNSWFIGIGRSKSGQRAANKNGTGSISDLERIPKRVIGKKLFYTNSMPYINKLEYGGYPNPSNGTKTIGGFSDQKKKGWVRAEILKMRKRIRAIK